MLLVDCKGYNAIEITKSGYKLLIDENAPSKYSTSADILISSLKEKN